MPELKLIRRWGSHEAGETVDVDDTTAAWLQGNHLASEDGSEDAARAGSAAPGTDGADPRAGGDQSRGGGMRTRRGPRGTDAAPDNRAHRVEGAPLADGSSPVWYSPAEIEAKREQKSKAEQFRAEERQRREAARQASEKRQAAAQSDGEAAASPAPEKPAPAPEPATPASSAGRASGK